MYIPDKSSLASKELSKLNSIRVILGVAATLLQRDPLTLAESELLKEIEPCADSELLAHLAAEVRAGGDPLGLAYCTITSSAARRAQGQTFTPKGVIDSMFSWASRRQSDVQRVVDPGAGSGRYTSAALKEFPRAVIVACEADPLVALILRTNLALSGADGSRVSVHVGDYRSLVLKPVRGPTLFIGNPPYVRHHDISLHWKSWYAALLKERGLPGSKLAGLHLHFFLKTLELAQPGDIGCFVTAAEWLDASYGVALRHMLTQGLGGELVLVTDPSAQVFGDALVSAAITCFAPGGASKELRITRCSLSGDMPVLKGQTGELVMRELAQQETKWTHFLSGGRPANVPGFIELGELFKVSRGQVTGLNKVWIPGKGAPSLPDRYLRPVVADALDITRAGKRGVDDALLLKKLVCLPGDLDEIPAELRSEVDDFLNWAQDQGAHLTYTAQHRRPWWRIPLQEPAPVVMTYMGRRPPVFALNKAKAHVVNIAHCLYPRRPISEAKLSRIVAWLNANVTCAQGRVYAGGLTKFEPSEAMRILLPEELAS